MIAAKSQKGQWTTPYKFAYRTLACLLKVIPSAAHCLLVFCTDLRRSFHQETDELEFPGKAPGNPRKRWCIL